MGMKESKPETMVPDKKQSQTEATSNAEQAIANAAAGVSTTTSNLIHEHIGSGATGGNNTSASMTLGTNGSIDLTKLDNCTPFSEITKQIRLNTPNGGTYKEIQQDGAISSKYTSSNIYYRRTWDGGKVSGGLTKWDINRNHVESAILDNTRSGSIIPNCVGGARGRFVELMHNIYPKEWKASWNQGVNNNPPFWHTTAPFSNKGISGTIDSLKELWTDEAGTFGPVGGKWGWRPVTANTVVLPGCFLTWRKRGTSGSGHVEFVEGLFNFGKSDEYIIATSSWYGWFTYGRILFPCKIKKNSTYGGYNYVSWEDDYTDTRVLYTPLCNISGALSGGIIKMELRPDVPVAEETQEAIEEVHNAIKGIELKKGDRVQIEWIGNMKSDGSGKKVNKLLMHGWVHKIHGGGTQYPYEVYDKASGGALLGCYRRDSLKLII